MTCDFTFFSTVFQSYQGDGWAFAMEARSTVGRISDSSGAQTRGR